MKTEAGHFVFCEHEAGPLGENAGARDEQGSATGWRPKGVAVLVFLLAVLAPAPLAAQKRSGDLLKFADQILSEISNMRGLEVRSPVNKGIKSRPQIQAALQEKISQEYTREELEIEEKTL